MKKIAAIAIVLVAGAAANAQVLDYGSTGPLLGNEFNTKVFPVAASGTITGFQITADMLATAGGNWQADMKLTITAPDSTVFTAGGFSTEVFPWNAQGGVGTFPGNNINAGMIDITYPVNLGNATGNWSVELRNDWSSSTNPLQWDNVKITLIPAPGAFALLGLGGLVAARRRRA